MNNNKSKDKSKNKNTRTPFSKKAKEMRLARDGERDDGYGIVELWSGTVNLMMGKGS